jgi:hypothetical protein
MTGLFSAAAAYSRPVEGDGTKRLYQWLSQRARAFRYEQSTENQASRTVRTEVTVERRGTTVILGDVGAAGFETCPLCGSKLAPEQAEQARLRLPRGPISA